MAEVTLSSRRDIIVFCPQAVNTSWDKTVRLAYEMTPMKHQEEGCKWMKSRPSGMFSVDMGGGKSLMALISSGVYGRPLQFLDLTVDSCKKRLERLRLATQTTSRGVSLVAVINYEAAWRGELGDFIKKNEWSCIIADESHRIKAPAGKASRFMHSLARLQPNAKRICLTGTPMPQSPLDLYGQFRFLDEGIFGTSYVRFRNRYAECNPRFPSQVRRYLNQNEFAAKLDAHSWRVMLDDVISLPESIHDTVYVSLSRKAKKIYDSLAENLTAEVEDGTVTVGNALSKLLRLAQVSNGYVAKDNEGLVPIDGIPEKRLALQDRLSDLPATEPVVVFCRFRIDLDEVKAAAKTLGREYAEVSGVRKDLQRWQDGDATILGVQIQSGGLGIDLTRAAFAFYYSLGFSLGDYEQSLARLRRPGQERMVRYYHIVSKGTVDEQVYAALRSRKNVIESVLNMLTKREINA